MTDLAIVQNKIPSMDEEAIAKVRDFENFSLLHPQCDITTSHILHGGLYSRTILVPAGVVITGVVIKIATLLIMQGDILVYTGSDGLRLQGYNILPASKNRKQVFVANTDTFLTMVFPTSATTIEEAEKEFTNETAALVSNKQASGNHIIITGE